MESDQTLFRAKFPYQPENADEIALQKGTPTFETLKIPTIYQTFFEAQNFDQKEKKAEPENWVANFRKNSHHRNFAEEDK